MKITPRGEDEERIGNYARTPEEKRAEREVVESMLQTGFSKLEEEKSPLEVGYM